MSEPASIDALLRRPGLPANERLLVKIKACIWPGDHETLATCLRHCQQLGVARSAVEEVLLQAVLFCGFPRIVNAFQILQDEWPTAQAPDGGGLPEAERRAAGDALFAAIYGDNTEAVKRMLQGFHGELHEFVLDTAYGRILSRPGLTPRLRELLAVAVLALTDQIPQMVAHGRGALKFGADEDQLREAIFTATGNAGAAGDLVRRIAARNRGG